MARRKWTLVILVVCVCPFVCQSRPSQETSQSTVLPTSITTEKPTENSSRSSSETSTVSTTSLPSSTILSSAPRDVKPKTPILGDSIKMVTSQLLHNPANSTEGSEIVGDTRIPPKLKNQLANKHKLKTRNEEPEEKTENSHAGIAVPVSMEELESENKVSETSNESSTSNQGISTWILLSNPTQMGNNFSSSTEPTKPEETTKKTKSGTSKNKTKRPQQNSNKITSHKRPIIGSTNKSDLIAGGSAINENVFNKIKDTVMSNVQKHKNASINRTTTTTTIAPLTTTIPTTKKEVATKSPSTTTTIAKVTSKPTKKKNKNKNKTTTTLAPTVNDSALLPIEAKEQEIELEISTPATTTKKPKRSSTKKKKKNKNKKKTSKPQTDSETSETKISNKTKVSKQPKKPNPISTQIYNYLSREVMPSVGVGIVGLAGLVGLAGYFLYPFATPVRRTFEVDKKDDIYRHNAEEYANEGNGQAEEEMLGTVLAGMPAHSKTKLNPYLAQTSQRYPAKKEKEQNIRYRQVPGSYESPNYSNQYQQNYQQKTGIAHGAIYSEPVNYNAQYETRHAYTTENSYPYEIKNTYSYPAVEPIYAASQTGPSAVASYGNEAANAIVYGVKPTQDTEFKPVYPYEGQVYSDTTSQSPMTYPPTSMYLGSNDDSEQPDQSKFIESDNSDVDNKFVVGNVPKELADSETPAVVPEHGPRKLKRKRRSPTLKKRSIVGSIEDILKAAKEGNKGSFLSNEIDDALGVTTKANSEIITELPSTSSPSTESKNSSLPKPTTKPQENDSPTVYPVYAVSVDTSAVFDKSEPIIKEEIVESISTLPLQTETTQKPTTESDLSNEVDITTKAFRVYEVFSTGNPPSAANANIENNDGVSVETTTDLKLVTETDLRSETTTAAPSSSSPVSQTKGPTEPTLTSTNQPKPTYNPNIITYPPYKEEGTFYTFIRRLLEFKYRLGISILQTTSDSLNRYLRSMEGSVRKMANASQF